MTLTAEALRQRRRETETTRLLDQILWELDVWRYQWVEHENYPRSVKVVDGR